MKNKWKSAVTFIMMIFLLGFFKIPSLDAQNSHNPPSNYYTANVAPGNHLKSLSLVSNKLSIRVSIKKGTYRLRNFIDLIASQVGLSPSYSKEFVPVDKEVQVPELKTSAKNALNRALIGTSMDFKVLEGKQLVFVKREASSLQVVQETINGTVTDAETGEPLAGVNILVMGSTIGTATDGNGNYTLEVPSLQDTLRFTYVGYKTRLIKINGRTTINVSLTPEALVGEELVVVGYGMQQKEDLTSAITVVDVEETFESKPITGVTDALQGVVPGLTITKATGEIGQSANITLRGIQGSLNATGAHPLILVNGVEVPSLNMLNPNSIESISVLKDAAATAIYGSEAAWGAILITTKDGRKNMPLTVTYNGNFAIQTPTENLEVAPAVEGTVMAFKALKRADPSLNSFGIIGMYFDQLAIKKMRQWQEKYGDKNLSDEMVLGRDFEFRNGKLFFYRPWDADDKFMKKWTPMQKHNLRIAGGGEHTSYSLGLGYLKQYGVMSFTTDTWTRYNLNLSINSTVKSWLDVRGDFMFARDDRVQPYAGYSSNYPMWYYLYRWPRIYPYGTYKGKPFRSAVTVMKQANLSTHEETFTRISVGATANITEGFNLDADFTYNNRNIHLHQTGGKQKGYNFWTGGGSLNYGIYSSPSFNNVNYSSYWDKRINFRTMATYQQDFANHSFTILAGGEAEAHIFHGQYSEKQGLLDPSKGQIDLAIGDQYVNGYAGDQATVGVFGRINYSYKDKYLLQINGRFDGSSTFPSNNRWGFFPSFSAAYVITEEPFMEFTEPILNFLKFRGSYGSVGNAAVGYYPFLSIMSAYGSDWLIGNKQSKVTFTTPGPVAPTLTWEQVSTLNLGVDARLFESALTMHFNWYKGATSGMLSAGVTLPATFGTAPPQRNYGELTATGWELKVTWIHNFNNEAYINITGTLSDFTEKISKYANTIKTIPFHISGYNSSFYEGLVLGSIWGYVTDRLFQRSDFKQDANGNLITDENGEYILKEGIPSQEIFETGGFSYGPGDVKYKDLNGDGVINYGENTVANPGDQKIIGNSTPKYLYRLRISGGWKGFDLTIFIQGVGSREFWAYGPVFVPGWRAREAWYAHQLDYWTPQNTDAFYPRPTMQVNSSNARNYLPQTRYLLDMAYMRLKNLTIGYTLPASILNEINVNYLRVYLSGQNLFEFENLYLPIDPETDFDPTARLGSFGRIYPFQRVVSIGIQMKF